MTGRGEDATLLAHGDRQRKVPVRSDQVRQRDADRAKPVPNRIRGHDVARGTLSGERFPHAERARMIAYIRSLPQHVLSGALRASPEYDSRKAATRVRGPILSVGTPTPYADLPRFRELTPQLVTGQLVGCGHYFPLEVPDQLAPMVHRFVDVFAAEG